MKARFLWFVEHVFPWCFTTMMLWAGLVTIRRCDDNFDELQNAHMNKVARCENLCRTKYGPDVVAELVVKRCICDTSKREVDMRGDVP